MNVYLPICPLIWTKYKWDLLLVKPPKRWAMSMHADYIQEKGKLFCAVNWSNLITTAVTLHVKHCGQCGYLNNNLIKIHQLV